MRVCRVLLAAIIVAIMSTGATYSDNPVIKPSLAALESALANELAREQRCNRQGLLSEMIEIGQLYCSMKQSGEIPWKSQLSGAERMVDQKDEYNRNLGDGVQLAVSKWSISHFGTADAFRKWLESFPNDIASPHFGCGSTEVALKDIAAAKADQHLCPGWPGHPRPPNL